jgi:hypothetical protein
VVYTYDMNGGMRLQCSATFEVKGLLWIKPVFHSRISPTLANLRLRRKRKNASNWIYLIRFSFLYSCAMRGSRLYASYSNLLLW